MGEKGRFSGVLFEYCMEGIIFFSEDGQILDANESARKSTGYFDELRMCNIADILPEIFYLNEGVLEKKKHLVPGEAFQSVAYCKNKLCFPIKIKILWETDDTIANTSRTGICIFADISAQVAAKRRKEEADEVMEQANQLRDEFVANLTHELRTPVNGIWGLATDLKKSPLTQDQQEDVDIIMHCCNNMTAMIGNLLDFSKMEANKLQLEEREFSLKGLLDKILGVYRPQMSRKGLKLVVNIASDLPEKVIGDDLRLEQIFLNLLSNALKFTAEGYIALEVLITKRTEESIELFSRIIDTGLGISEDKLELLFQRFSQVDGSITRKHGGTGLGLSISKKLVTMMGGVIWVDSKLGKGSSFSFTVNLKTTTHRRKELGEMPVAQNNKAVREWLEPEEPQNGRPERFIKIMERLAISVEMENKEKAEAFAEQLKAMIPEEGKELWRAVLRVQMDMRKADYVRASEDMERLQELTELQECALLWE